MKTISKNDYKNLLNDFRERDLLESTFTFECHSEGMITFHCVKNNHMMEVNFISDDYFVRDMTGKGIVELKNIGYINYAVYEIEEDSTNRIEIVEYKNL